MALGLMSSLAGARTAADRTVPTQSVRRRLGVRPGHLSADPALRPPGGGPATAGLRRLVAGFAHGAHVIHLAHRPVTR